MNEPRVVESVTNECQSLGRAHESSSARAEQLIACLEGEIAKRDARLLEMDAQCMLAGVALDLVVAEATKLRAELSAIKAQEPVTLQHMAYSEDGELHWMTGRKAGVCELYAMPDFGRAPKLYAAPVAKPQVMMPKRIQIAGHLSAVEGYRASGWNQCLDEVARLNAAPVQQVSVPDERIIPTSAELIQWAWEEEPEETRFQEGYNAAKRWVKMQIEAGIAAPAVPAADAGLVEALDYQALFDAIAAATSVYANGAINISVQAFRESLAAHRANGVV